MCCELYVCVVSCVYVLLVVFMCCELCVCVVGSVYVS